MFHFYEVYESDTAFTEFYNSKEMRDFLQKVERLAASDIGMTYVRLADWLFVSVAWFTHSFTRAHYFRLADKSACTR